MKRDYAKANFYSEFTRKNSVKNDVATFVQNEGEASGFYELCAEFLDIALDAPKFQDGTTIIGEKDYEHAATSALVYIAEHDISDVNGLLELIYEHHSHAHRMNDTRPTSGQVEERDPHKFGSIGTWYNFCKIPAANWADIKCWIIDKIKN